MIIYDTPRVVRFRGRYRRTSHLVSTLTDPFEALTELDEFALRIGLKLKWVENPGTATEHFDLFDGAIDRARAAGATEVTPRELIAQAVRPKREALKPKSQQPESPGVVHG